MTSHGLAWLCAALLAVAPAFGQTHQWAQRLSGSGLGNPFFTNPANENTLYASAGGNGGVFVSRDRGQTWDTLGIVPGGGSIKAICVRTTDSLTFLAGQERSSVPDRVVRSTDGGATWTETLSGEFSFYGVPVEFSTLHPDTVYTMMGTAIYRSTNFGATWEARGTQPGFNTWCDAAVRPDSADILYVGDNASGIWKTTDGGVTFRNVYHSAGEIPMIAVDDADPAVAYATKFFGSGSGVVKSTDFGETWSELAAFQGFTQCWGIAIDRTDHRRIAVGTYSNDLARSGIYLSSDAGATWLRTACGLTRPYSLNYGLLALDSASVLALQDDGIFALERIDLGSYPRGSVSGALRDSTTQFPVRGRLRLTQATCDSTAVAVREADSTGAFRFDGLAVSDGPLAASYSLTVDPELPYARRTFAGIDVTPAGVVLPVALRTADVFLVAVDSGDHRAYYEDALGALGLGISFWNVRERGPAPLSRGSEFAQQVVVYYAAGRTSPLSQGEDSSLVASLEAGCNLLITGQDLLERNPSAEIFTSSLGIGFGGNASIVYCEGSPGEILDGVSFFTNGSGADYPQSRDVITVSGLETDAILGYGPGGASGFAGVRRRFAPAPGNAVFLGFGFESINPADRRIAALDRILRYFAEPVSVPAGERRLPAGRLLRQNYPNPFNPSTTIAFTVPTRSRVTLRIYDVLGREAAAPLVAALMEEGEASVDVDARDLPSGVYLYRLELRSLADEHPVRAGGVETRKMLLVR